MAVSSEKQNVEINDDQDDQRFTVTTNDRIASTNENTVYNQTLDRNFTYRNARSIDKVVETFEDGIQKVASLQWTTLSHQ